MRGWFRLLTFRSTREELRALDRQHLWLGLIVTWLVGAGRWHAPYASPAQHAGLGSLVYVCALSGLVWLLYLPLRLEAWSFRRTLTFVSLLSAPAILEVPVHHFFDSWDARVFSAWLMGLVTLWRVALLLWFLVRAAGLPPFAAVVSLLLPVDLIVYALAYLGVEHDIDRYVNAMRELDLLGLLAALALVPTLIAYALLVAARLGARRGKST